MGEGLQISKIVEKISCLTLNGLGTENNDLIIVIELLMITLEVKGPKESLDMIWPVKFWGFA